MDNVQSFRVGSVSISATNPIDAESRITKAAISGKGGYVCVTNLRMVMYADSNPEYAKLMDKSFMNLPDGMPLTWCGKLWGVKGVARTCGPELFRKMLQNGDKNLKHFLLGDTDDVLHRIKETYQHADIVGAETLPFTKVEDFDYKNIAQRVADSKANIIWTAMTAPKQDEFNQRLYKYLPNIVSVGVGRAFRLSIGQVSQAPSWAVKLGLGGFFIRRRRWYETGWWYIRSSFTLLKYLVQIMLHKIIQKDR